MKKIFFIAVYLIITLKMAAQFDQPVIPITEESGIYEMTSNSYKLLYHVSYETFFQINDDGSPNTDNYYYQIKKNNNIVYEAHCIISDDRICITMFNGEGQRIFYTCIGFDKFLYWEDVNVAQHCFVSETNQLRIFYYKDLDVFFLIDVPIIYQSNNVVLHLLLRTM